MPEKRNMPFLNLINSYLLKNLIIFAPFFNRWNMGKRIKTIILFFLFLIINVIIGNISYTLVSTDDETGRISGTSRQAQFESPQDQVEQAIEYLLLQKNSDQPYQVVSVPSPHIYNLKYTLYPSTILSVRNTSINPSPKTSRETGPFLTRKSTCYYVYTLERILI